MIWFSDLWPKVWISCCCYSENCDPITPCAVMWSCYVGGSSKRHHGLVLWWLQVPSCCTETTSGHAQKKHTLSFYTTETVELKGLCVVTVSLAAQSYITSCCHITNRREVRVNNQAEQDTFTSTFQTWRTECVVSHTHTQSYCSICRYTSLWSTSPSSAYILCGAAFVCQCWLWMKTVRCFKPEAEECKCRSVGSTSKTCCRPRWCSRRPLQRAAAMIPFDTAEKKVTGGAGCDISLNYLVYILQQAPQRPAQ